MSAVGTSSASHAVEDREVYEQLARLQAVYKQMFELRTLLPEKLVNPTRAILQPSSRSAPEKLAAQLKEAAVTGSKDIQNFKKDYHSDAMRELFQKVNAAEISQGQDVWTVDYGTLVQKMNAGGSKPETSSEVIDALDDSINDNEAVKQFRDAYPNLELKILDEASGIPLELTISPAIFYVSKIDEGSKSRYAVALKDSDRQPQLGKDLVQYVQTNHADEGLPALLSLLASYENLRSQKCEKCGRTFNTSLQFPVARDRRPPNPDQKQPAWAIRHQKCSP